MVGRAGGTDAGTDGDGAGGSSVCSATRGRSSSGISKRVGPRLVLEVEDERHKAWPAVDR